MRRTGKPLPRDLALQKAAAEQPQAYQDHTNAVRFWKPGY